VERLKTLADSVSLVIRKTFTSVHKMGNMFRKLLDSLWGLREMRVVMLGKLISDSNGVCWFDDEDVRLTQAPFSSLYFFVLLHQMLILIKIKLNWGSIGAGLDAAGKTTILYKLHIGEVLSTVPTIGNTAEKLS